MQCAELLGNYNRGKEGDRNCTLFLGASTIKTESMKAEIKDLNQLADYLAEATLLTQKEVLTSAEVAKYMGISKAYLYKLTMKQQIPHYKPLGKLCYFQRAEVEAWLQSNRVATEEELNNQAQAYCMKKGGKA